MNFLARMSIAQKLFLIPIIGTLSFGVYIAISISSAYQNVDTLNEARLIHTPALLKSKDALNSMQNVKDTLSSAVTTGDEDALEKANELFDNTIKTLDRIIGLGKNVESDIKLVKADFVNYYEIAYGVSKSMVNNTADFTKIQDSLMTMNNLFDSSFEKLSEFSRQREVSFNQAIETANASAKNLITLGIVIGIATTIILFATALPIVNNLKKSIGNLVVSLRDIAQEDGDLTIRLESNNKDEVGDLVYWFNQFVAKLQGVVGDIGHSSQPLSDIADNLNQVSQIATDTIYSQRTAASSAKHAVDDMTHSVNSVAEHAREAAQAAHQASDAAKQGELVVGHTVGSIQSLASRVDETAVVIKKLEEDSNKVGVVLDVIKGIAEQTNLLALNAAIEAARAGEQGRGFAVVADEVRTLASRTQKSTEEIQTTIEQLQSAAHSAVEAMAKGTEQAIVSVDEANKAGASLQEINQTISKITGMNAQIAEATSEQQKVAQLITQNVDEIDSKTEATTSSSDRLSEVSSELKQLSSDFNRIMKQFKY